MIGVVAGSAHMADMKALIRHHTSAVQHDISLCLSGVLPQHGDDSPSVGDIHYMLS